MSAQPGILLQPGARPLPDYELAAFLGAGGMGQVWSALGPGGFEVALKFVRLGGTGHAAELKALQVIKGIRHPHLLCVFGSWEKDGWLIVAMERADRSLLDRLKEAVAQGHPGIPRAELHEYMREAAKGLDHLTGLAIVHRDVKPHNLFLCGGGIKVADYGLARILQHALTTASISMTPAYAPPEVIDGRLSAMSDQYSLAVSYCQLRGNRLPFEGSVVSMIARHISAEPDLSMLPAGERPVVAKALAKRPAERWSSCKTFVEALGPSPAALAPRADPLPAVAPQAADLASTVRMPAPAVTKITNSLDMAFVHIPPGEFLMGSPPEEAGREEEEFPHQVLVVQPFFLGIHQVTQEQYRKVMGANPSHFQGERGGGIHHPVENVSWANAQEFLRRLNDRERGKGRLYRLPTEAEWEYACRAGTATRFHTGDEENPLQDAAWLAANAQRKTHRVGEKAPNAWGLYDMHGNVLEWCQDAYARDFYRQSPLAGPVNEAGDELRVQRGGSWNSPPVGCRCARRYRNTYRNCNNTVGFRVALTLADLP